MHMKYLLFLIFLTIFLPVFGQEPMNFTTQIKEIEIDIDEINTSILNLKKDMALQDERTQEKILRILDNFEELKTNTEINENNIKEIIENIDHLNHQIKELHLENVGVYGKNIQEPVFVEILEDFYPKTILDYALVISSIASIILVLIVRKQTQTVKKDSEIKFRPWIRIEDTLYDVRGIVQATDGSSHTWKDFWKKYTKEQIIRVTVHSGAFNGGSLPTEASRIQSLYSKTKISKEELLEKGRIHTIQPIMPQETQTWKYFFPKEDYIWSETKSIFLGVECIYKVEENLTYKIGKIWKLTGTAWVIEEYWFKKIPEKFEDVIR